MIKLIPAWRPRLGRRDELVQWLGSLAEHLACAALGHPLAPSYGSITAWCHCTRRHETVAPSSRRE